MDELIKQGQWWWPFAVPVAAGIFALVGSWFGTKWGKTTEHQQWLRNERTKVYADFLSAIAEEIWKIKHSGSPYSAKLKFPNDLLARMDVVGSHTVRKAAWEYARHMNVFETVRAILAGDGDFLAVPGPDTAKHQDQYAKEHERLIHLGDQFRLVVRKDLGTADKSEAG